MKIIKHSRILALLVAFCAIALSGVAQKQKSVAVTDADAAIKAIAKIAPKYSSSDLEMVVADVCAKFKKNPDVYVKSADIFMYRMGSQDTLNAYKYIRKALSIDSKYVPAYILLGDISWAYDDTLKSIGYYKQAIAVSPNDLRGYNTLANCYRRMGDMDGVISTLKSAKDANPTFPCNLQIARIYNTSADIDAPKCAIAYYQKAELDSMNANDYANYASNYHGLALLQPEKADKYALYGNMLAVCDSGLQVFPNNGSILNAALIAATEAYSSAPDADAKRHMADLGVNYGNLLFTHNDTLVKNTQCKYYGYALMRKNSYTKAIDVFQRLYQMSSATDKDRNDAIEQMSKAYKELGEYDKAEQLYAQNIEALEKAGTLEYVNMQDYAKVYEAMAEELNGQAKIDAYNKADQIYRDAAKRFPEYAAYGYFAQYKLRTNEYMDPDKNNGLAIEPTNNLYTLLSNKPDLSSAEEYFLTNACYYLANYYFKVQSNNTKARPYFVRWNKLDPSNENVRLVLTKVYKMKL